MKIALVNKFYPPIIGGIEYHVRLLAENLQRYNDVEKIEVIVANDRNNWQQEQCGEKIYVTRLPSWKIVASTPIAPSFIRYFKEIDADIVHFHFPYPFADFSWIVAGVDKPYVVTYHSDILRQKMLNYLYTPIRDKFFRRADKIIATSPRLIEYSNVLQKFKSKTISIPLGISPQIFLSNDGKKKGNVLRKQYSSDKPIVLFVGRLVYYKGVEYLIEAFKDVNATLIMIGKGPLRDKLHNMVATYKIQDKVFFYENVSDDELVGFYHVSDIFVLPSIANTEAYGLVQLEAMACGKPVISTNLPTGVPYVNEHNKTGIVVEPRDINGLKKALNKLSEDKTLRKKLGDYAKERMLNNFTDQVMAKRVLDVYKDVLFI